MREPPDSDDLPPNQRPPSALEENLAESQHELGQARAKVAELEARIQDARSQIEAFREKEPVDIIRRLSGVQEHDRLSGSVGKLWEAVCEVQDDPVLGHDPLIIPPDGLPTSVSAGNTAKVIDQYVDTRVIWVNEEDDMEDAARQIRDAVASIPGSKAYNVGDNGDDIIVIVTKDPDALAEALESEQAIWVHGLPSRMQNAYRDLAEDGLQPEDEDERVVFEIQES